MVPVRTGWIGVDLGAAAIKLAQLERDGRGLRLTASAVLQRELPPSAAGEARVLSSSESAPPAWSPREIRAAFDLEPNFRGRPAACVLSTRQAGVRMIALPSGSDAELRAMIVHHLQETLGPEAVECEFDYWDASTPGGEAESPGVGVVYTPRRTAIETARNLSAVGLNCEVLDGLPLALARAVQMLVPDDDRNVAVVDWGHEQVLLAVVQGGRPLFIRQLRGCSYGALVGRVAAELKLSPHDVQQVLALYGVHASEAGGDAAEMTRLLTRLAGREILALEQELLRTLDHLRLHRSGLLPRQIVLCGGGATIAGIDAELTFRLDHPVIIWRLLHGDDPPNAGQPNYEPLLASAAALSALAWAA